MLYIFFPLSITLLFEPIIVSLIKKFDFKLFLSATLINIILNPLMNSIIYHIKDGFTYYLVLSCFEILTVFIETILIKTINKTAFKKTLLFVFLANAASLVMGIIINPLFYANIVVLIINYVLFIVLFILTFILYSLNKENNCNNKTSS